MSKILNEQELTQLLDPLLFLGASITQIRELFHRKEAINQSKIIHPSEEQGLDATVKDIDILRSEISTMQNQSGNQVVTDADDIFTQLVNSLNKTRNAFRINNDVVSTLEIAANLQILVQTLVLKGIRNKTIAPLQASIKEINQLTEVVLAATPQPIIVGNNDLPDIQPLSRNLELGHTGADVRDVKEFLKAYGCLEAPVSDTFDLHTKNAVAKFQIQAGLDPDGEVGPNTIKAMRDARTQGQQKEPPSKPPDIPSDITAKRILLADIAEREGKKGLTWKSSQSAAEKFLKPLRAALGGFSGRYEWCGAFTLWCCREAGLKLPDKPKESRFTYALVAAWHDWASVNKMWLPASTRPKKGDIILFDWKETPGRFNHIGLVIADQLPGHSIIKTAEGNAGNITAIKSRLPATVAGYIRINKA